MAKRNLRVALALPLVAVLAGCSGDGPSPPGAETVGEARALDDAAHMLDQRRAPPADATSGKPADHARP